MKPALVVILSGALTFGVPLLIAIWEVMAMRRESRRGWGPDAPPAPEPPGPRLGPSPAQRPLPACLIPQRQPGLGPNGSARPARVLEPV